MFLLSVSSCVILYNSVVKYLNHYVSRAVCFLPSGALVSGPGAGGPGSRVVSGTR